MRLSQLLKYKLDLQNHNSDGIISKIEDNISHLHQLSLNSERFTDAGFFQELQSRYRSIYETLNNVDSFKLEKINELEKAISDWGKQYFITVMRCTSLNIKKLM